MERFLKQNATGKEKLFGPTLLIRTNHGHATFEMTSTLKKALGAPLPLPTLSLKKINRLPEKPDPETLYFDRDLLPKGQLKVRTWKSGDRFQPSGMQGTKKLQDYFTDKKIHGQERRHVPILVTHKDEIVAVGPRIDERYRATQQSKNILCVNLK